MEVAKLADGIKSQYIKKNKERAEMIQKAIDASYCILPILEFINTTGFKFNEAIRPYSTNTDMMWNVFYRNIPVYVTDELIKMFGYSGAGNFWTRQLRVRQLSLRKLICGTI